MFYESWIVFLRSREIAPGGAGPLWQPLFEDMDIILSDALAECYNTAGSWAARRQIFSIMADKVTLREVQKWFLPTLSKRRNCPITVTSVKNFRVNKQDITL